MPKIKIDWFFLDKINNHIYKDGKYKTKANYRG